MLSHAPIAVQRLIKRCLKKDPTARLHDIADAGLEIEDAVAESAPLIVQVPGVDAVAFLAQAGRGHRRGRRSATLAVLVALGVLDGPDGRHPPAPERVSRVVVPVPSGQHVERGGLAPLAISPDGTRLVYAAAQDEGRTQLFMRPLDQFGPTAIAGTEGGSAPFFSPDGRSIGFYANGTLQRVSVDGGRALEICDDARASRARPGAPTIRLCWTAARPVGLWRVPAAGTTPERLTTVDAAAGELQHAYPRRLPNGDVLFGVMTDRGWHLADAVARRASRCARSASLGAVAPARSTSPQTGQLLYANAGGLVAVPFDRIVGEGSRPASAAPGTSGGGPIGQHVVRGLGVGNAGLHSARVDAAVARARARRPHGTRRRSCRRTRAAFAHPRLSPDGRRLAVAIESDNGSDIWIYDVDHGTPTPLVTGGVNRFPIWSADGQQITFQSARSGGVSLYSKRVERDLRARSADSIRERPESVAVAGPGRPSAGDDADLHQRESAPADVVGA